MTESHPPARSNCLRKGKLEFEPVYILGLFVAITDVSLTEKVPLKLTLSLRLLAINSVDSLNIMSLNSTKTSIAWEFRNISIQEIWIKYPMLLALCESQCCGHTAVNRNWTFRPGAQRYSLGHPEQRELGRTSTDLFQMYCLHTFNNLAKLAYPQFPKCVVYVPISETCWCRCVDVLQKVC